MVQYCLQACLKDPRFTESHSISLKVFRSVFLIHSENPMKLSMRVKLVSHGRM